MARNKRNKVGLALGGGAALGLTHLGVLKCFKENNFAPDYVSGTSAGAIVAACYAFGITSEEISSKVKDLSWFKLAKFSYSTMGLSKMDFVGSLIEELVGKVNIEDSKIPLAIVATDIESGKKVVLRKGDLSKAVMASACIPGIFAPIEIDGRYLVDGGLTENLPMSPLKDMGATVAIGVNLHRWRKYRKPANVVDVMTNALDILVKNQAKTFVCDREILIEPYLEEFTPSDFKLMDGMMEQGYKAAEMRMAEINSALEMDSIEVHKKSKMGFWRRIIGKTISKMFS